MRIAISTLVDYSNYGNRLQNYALQKVIENMGHSVITIRDFTDKTSEISLEKKVLISVKNGDFFEKVLNKIRSKKNKENNQKREENFRRFTERYIHESEFILNEKTKDYDFDDFIDTYVIGSDQVWNYTFNSFSEASFVLYSKKPKISYAASFGVTEVPQQLLGFYKKGLEQVDYISVRENAGQRLVQEMTNQDSVVVVDPTLLLDKQDWLDIGDTGKIYREKYLLTYFLGEKDQNQKDYIIQYAADNNYVIKELADMNDKDNWTADPSEFINLFSQAEAVFTDSFHASVFSIIFEKYFEVFERKSAGPSMNSRLDTLLKDLNLEDRWHRDKMTCSNINYKQVNEILAVRKQESRRFLEEALNNIERGTKEDE